MFQLNSWCWYSQKCRKNKCRYMDYGLGTRHSALGCICCFHHIVTWMLTLQCYRIERRFLMNWTTSSDSHDVLSHVWGQSLFLNNFHLKNRKNIQRIKSKVKIEDHMESHQFETVWERARQLTPDLNDSTNAGGRQLFCTNNNNTSSTRRIHQFEIIDVLSISQFHCLMPLRCRMQSQPKWIFYVYNFRII